MRTVFKVGDPVKGTAINFPSPGPRSGMRSGVEGKRKEYSCVGRELYFSLEKPVVAHRREETRVHSARQGCRREASKDDRCRRWCIASTVTTTTKMIGRNVERDFGSRDDVSRKQIRPARSARVHDRRSCQLVERDSLFVPARPSDAVLHQSTISKVAWTLR